VAEHVIKIPKDLKSIYKKPYRLPFSQEPEIEKQIGQMVKDELIDIVYYNSFLQRECLFVGHVISDESIKLDKKKIEAEMYFPVPTNVKQINSFLGVSGYYRKCIENYSAIDNPMVKLLRKDVKFNWGESCQKALDQLKEILCSEPILRNSLYLGLVYTS